MEFKDDIIVKSRLGNDIHLKLVKKCGGYFPGCYYNNYLYKNNKNEYFWCQKTMEHTDEFGQFIKDWTILPSDIIEMIWIDMPQNFFREKKLKRLLK